MKKRIFQILAILLILFIWWNSSIIGKQSNYLSTVLTQNLFSQSNTSFHILHLLVRKAGHILEYTLLTFVLYQGFIKPYRLSIYLLLLITPVIAIFDELIQAYTPGRTASLIDVLIDCCAIFLVCMILRVTVKSKN